MSCLRAFRSSPGAYGWLELHALASQSSKECRCRLHEFFANFLFRDDSFSHIGHYLVFACSCLFLFLFVVAFYSCFHVLLRMLQCQGPFDIQLFDLLRAPQPCSWTVFRLRLWCNAVMLRRYTVIRTVIHCIKVKWCANLHQFFPCECNWVCNYTDWNYTLLPIWSYEKESGVTEVRRHSWCFVRGALCCLGLCSLFVGSPSVQVAVQLCAVSTTKCRKKKNSEFSLLCLSLCEFEFQRTVHILPDSDNHKWEWNSSAVCIPETSTQWESFQSSRWSQWSRRIFLAASMVPCAMCPRNTFWSNDMFHIVKENSIG